jgi:hypothetical protein
MLTIMATAADKESARLPKYARCGIGCNFPRT